MHFITQKLQFVSFFFSSLLTSCVLRNVASCLRILSSVFFLLLLRTEHQRTWRKSKGRNGRPTKRTQIWFMFDFIRDLTWLTRPLVNNNDLGYVGFVCVLLFFFLPLLQLNFKWKCLEEMSVKTLDVFIFHSICGKNVAFELQNLLDSLRVVECSAQQILRETSFTEYLCIHVWIDEFRGHPHIFLWASNREAYAVSIWKMKTVIVHEKQFSSNQYIKDSNTPSLLLCRQLCGWPINLICCLAIVRSL